MSLLKSTLVQRVRDILGDDPWTTVFTGNINASVTTVAVPDGTKWDEGDVLEFQDNGEQSFVRSVSVNNLTVIRGVNGSTAAAHDGSVTAIQITKLSGPSGAAFSYKKITDDIGLAITGLYPYLWKKSTTTVTPAPTTTVWYNLNSAYLEPIQVSQLQSTTPETVMFYGKGGGVMTAGWPSFRSISPLPFYIEKNLPTSLCASGVGIYFPRGLYHEVNNIQVDYLAKITTTETVAGTYDDINEGILAEVVAYGAAKRLVQKAEIPNVTQSDNTMGDASVGTGVRRIAARDLELTYTQLRNQYREELMATIPPAGKWRG